MKTLWRLSRPTGVSPMGTTETLVVLSTGATRTPPPVDTGGFSSYRNSSTDSWRSLLLPPSLLHPPGSHNKLDTRGVINWGCSRLATLTTPRPPRLSRVWTSATCEATSWLSRSTSWPSRPSGSDAGMNTVKHFFWEYSNSSQELGWFLDYSISTDGEPGLWWFGKRGW